MKVAVRRCRNKNSRVSKGKDRQETDTGSEGVYDFGNEETPEHVAWMDDRGMDGRLRKEEVKRKGGKKVTKKKDCVFRAARELNDKDFSQRVANRAEEVGYKGYDRMIEEGKALFARDLEELRG